MNVHLASGQNVVLPEVEPQLQHGGGRWSQAVSERSQHFAQAVALESDEEKQEAVTWHAIVARVVKVR